MHSREHLHEHVWVLMDDEHWMWPSVKVKLQHPPPLPPKLTHTHTPLSHTHACCTCTCRCRARLVHTALAARDMRPAPHPMGLARMCMRVQEGYSVDLLIGSQKIQMRTLHSRPRLFYLSSACRSRPSHPAHICARTSLRQPTPIARRRCATPPRFSLASTVTGSGALWGDAMAVGNRARTVRCCGPPLRLRFRADFLTAAECDYIISRSESQLKRSEASSPTHPSTLLPTHPPTRPPTRSEATPPHPPTHPRPHTGTSGGDRTWVSGMLSSLCRWLRERM